MPMNMSIGTLLKFYFRKNPVKKISSYCLNDVFISIKFVPEKTGSVHTFFRLHCCKIFKIYIVKTEKLNQFDLFYFLFYIISTPLIVWNSIETVLLLMLFLLSSVTNTAQFLQQSVFF